MAWKGIYRSDEFWFVSPTDPEPGNPTKFKLKPMSQRQLAWARDRFTNVIAAEGDSTKFIPKLDFRQMNYLIVQIGLAGWENFLGGPDGDKPLDFSTVKMEVAGQPATVASFLTMDCLPSDLVAELAAKIVELSELSAEQKKSAEESGTSGESTSSEDMPNLH